MQYQLEMKWNGTTVMDARITATLAHATIAGFMIGNFTGDAALNACAVAPKLSDILNMDNGENRPGIVADDTGKAEFSLTRRFGGWSEELQRNTTEEDCAA